MCYYRLMQPQNVSASMESFREGSLWQFHVYLSHFLHWPESDSCKPSIGLRETHHTLLYFTWVNGKFEPAKHITLSRSINCPAPEARRSPSPCSIIFVEKKTKAKPSEYLFIISCTVSCTDFHSRFLQPYPLSC